MSGEFYILEELVDQDSDTNIEVKDGYKNADSNNNPASSRSGKESKLHDIEKQIEMAESRCSCLKNQLDYMKQLYGVQESETNTARTVNTTKCVTTSRISTLKKRYEGKADSEIKLNDNVKCKGVRVNQGVQADVCENSEFNNGDCMMRSPLVMDPEPHEKLTRVVRLPTKKEASRINKASRKLTVRIPKTSTNNNSSSHTISKASKKSIRKIQSNARTSKRQKNTGKHQIITSQKVSDISALKLVEIYHNAAVKGSDSEESINGKKTKRKGINNTSRISQQQIPPLKINVKPNEETPRKNIICQDSCTETQFSNANNIINNASNYKQMVPSSKECSVYSKNYTLPTIASRLKQVAKNYLSAYNFKAIPFCAAIATTPSHNIGINIQQVMNIIKTRQPVHGLSPTLTHNIVLAANKLNCTPLSTFISTIASKADYALTKHMCPLSKSTVNYHQLEEMAKTVPDDVINEENEDIVDNDPPIETTTITGPSGEIQIHNRQRILWSMENNNNKTMCTCVPQSGLELQQVVTKYQSNHTIYTNSQISGTSTRLTLKRQSRKGKRCGVSDSRTRQMKTISEQIIPHHAEEMTPLQGKEKNLKEVLTNLHNEFESLNKRYEEFAAQANEKGDEERVNAELSKLESELNNKEEEITMVMALYKEVLALKQQIKSLKRQASSKQVVSSKDNITKFQDYNNPRAAFHLTKLLRQIQHYQMHYKKSGHI